MTIPLLSIFKKRPIQPSLSDQLLVALKPKAKRILMLEDDRLWRELIALFARDFDLEIVEVTNGTDARVALMSRGTFDAAIIDIGIVNGDGISFYQWVKETLPKLQVVFLTGADIDKVSDRIHAIGSAPIYHKQIIMTPSFIEDFLMQMGARRRVTTA